jgi:hypothetical protein
MAENRISGGVAHQVPDDLNTVLLSNDSALLLWNNLTPLGRNEFLCWVENAKQDKTRTRRIERTVEELLEGQRRPCCWVGCIHRTDKKPSKWQQDVLIDKKPKP